MNSGPSSRQRRLWLLAALAFWAVIHLTGCATLSDWSHAWMRPAPPTTPSDRFPVPAEGTDIVGALQVTTTGYEDTLVDIARRYDLGYDEIVAANPGVDPWLPGEGTKVVLPTEFVLPGGAREGLVLNLAAMRLFYYPPSGPRESAVVITHPIGIGREGWQTPQGTARIVQKIEKPAWTVPESVRREHAEQGDPLPPVVPPGPDNALGDYAMRLSLPSYLIHGTNKPYGVGMRVSHGCVRLYPEDIASLFAQVPVGTPVRIVNEPYLAGWRNGELFLEAHQPLSEEAKRWNGSLSVMEKAITAKASSAGEINWDRARQVAGEARGMPVPITSGSPELAELLARAPRVPSTPPWAAAPNEKGETDQRTASANARGTNYPGLKARDLTRHVHLRDPDWRFTP